MKTKQSFPLELPASQYPTPQDQDTQKEGKLIHYLDELILGVFCLSFIIVLQLPTEYIDGRPVPTVIFKGRASLFHAFLVSLTGSCYGSVCSIYLRERMPMIGSFFYFLGAVSMVVSLGIFSWLAVPAGLMWMVSRFC